MRKFFVFVLFLFDDEKKFNIFFVVVDSKQKSFCFYLFFSKKKKKILFSIFFCRRRCFLFLLALVKVSIVVDAVQIPSFFVVVVFF